MNFTCLNRKKIISVFSLLLCFAIYDTLIKRIDGFPVGLVVFFYCAIYCFILFTIYAIEVQNRFDKKVLTILSLPFILRIVLNLLAIGKDRQGYNNLVSNEYIDHMTWLTIVILLILLLWERFIIIRQ